MLETEYKVGYHQSFENFRRLGKNREKYIYQIFLVALVPKVKVGNLLQHASPMFPREQGLLSYIVPRLIVLLL